MNNRLHRDRGRYDGARRLILCAAYCVPVLGVGSVHGQDADQKEPPKRERDVGKRLIRDVAESADADLMAQIMRLMSDVQQRLDVEFDPGEGTRATQQEIVDRLNDAIQLAARQRRNSRQSAASSSDKRSRPDKARAKPKDRGSSQSQAKASESSDTTAGTADVASADAKAGNMHETRRTWGNLPKRDRDEVIQGSDEAHLERFRKWIERYYQALQETDE